MSGAGKLKTCQNVGRHCGISCIENKVAERILAPRTRAIRPIALTGHTAVDLPVPRSPNTNTPPTVGSTAAISSASFISSCAAMADNGKVTGMIETFLCGSGHLPLHIRPSRLTPSAVPSPHARADSCVPGTAVGAPTTGDEPSTLLGRPWWKFSMWRTSWSQTASMA
jgi:hypothetical protein